MMWISRSSIISRLISIAALCVACSLAVAQQKSPGQEYIGPNRIFSVPVPKAPNWAGVPYTITTLATKGDKQYDKVMFHADDFGQYLVAGARVMPGPAVSQMDKDEPRALLRNLSQATLMGWRTDLNALPEVAHESSLDSKHGKAIIRIYRARKGSFIAGAQGRQPTRDDVFDTNIASIVARQGSIVVFVLAQNDASADDSNVVMGMATELFEDLRVLVRR